ncbi:hypothetical protein RHOER0001_3781 [Rhodococcus erythropolis SK121]|nr:hypothetical protein RHOER0001_3781 [Rhodococcus erythropolis SK121]
MDHYVHGGGYTLESVHEKPFHDECCTNSNPARKWCVQ